MGRPKLDNLHDCKLQVWLTADEKAQLQQEAGAEAVSSYVRGLLVDRSLRPVVPEPNQKKWLELSKTAANLNQLMRAVNRGIIPASPELLATITTLLAFVNELRNSLVGKDYEG